MKTTRNLLGGLAGLALVLFTGPSALGIALNNSGTGNNWFTPSGFQTGQGGEFYFQTLTGPVNNSAYNALTKNQGGVSNSFQTFCLEVPESLGHNGVTYVVNDEAVNGGPNTHSPAGDQLGDRLSVGTAWLYSLFAQATLGVPQGILGSYAFSGIQAQRKASAGLLQNAFWALEDEIADPSPGANIFFDAAVTHFGGSLQAQTNAATGQFGVWVLNNTLGGVKKQDMLFYAGGASVPDGGSTAILLGLSMGGIAFLLRQKKSSSIA